MVSQFIGEKKVPMLGTLGHPFPEGIHAVGRLDAHSEGLLLLTNNKKVTNLLFNSGVPHKRTYLVRVKNTVSPESLEKLRNGVTIRIKDGVYYQTPPCEVNIVDCPENIPPHQRELRHFVAHTWLTITIYEGKYHQVRKMVSAVNHRCLRLIRISIEDIELGDLKPGCIEEIGEAEFFSKLKIEYPVPSLAT